MVVIPLRSWVYRLQSDLGKTVSTSARSTASHRSDKNANEKSTSYVALTRILSNLVAGALVFLSVATLIALLSQVHNTLLLL
ncbi:hypothetical protein SPRG_00566 [Saprolegnia parasitica CBS 223.65]|uniref:Uncharacterized protein n=1 Tax=Saprolegnia parasitica (strain CBS 223.65) TaxID=695850 RepID=A0A067CVF1_SAPPC|nr:hypothetical protein SPRG_00566 [Saprolegnia parasitica CBS 223.65]KDO34503.1 hypothetical protein SPRG_00566 [Saprolegnia parasitica CBS 223.65]|eukprot:XP_012194182.1 hypothetical protein SPRG_00566 [Saprolegnia parasitica CBS 223.65]